jgi:flagellar biogenesis protein FliO
MVKFFLVFTVILVLLLIIWWILKNRKIPWIRFPSKELKHIEGLYLGMNSSLHIIKYKNRCFLIGCSPNSIVLLKEFTDEENV